jgi:hypothetical protein
MSNAFAAMDATLFTDPHQSRAAIYTPVGGLPVRLRAVVYRPDEVQALLSTGTQRPSRMADLLTAAVPVRPTDGATLKVETVTYTIRQATADELGLVWRCDLDGAT